MLRKQNLLENFRNVLITQKDLWKTLKILDLPNNAA